MKRLGAVLIAISLAGAATGSAAQKPAAKPRAVDPESAIVSDLIVRPKVAGPAWWRVSDADTVVYVIGMPGHTLPRGLKWDHTAFERRIKGANVFIESITWPVGRLQNIVSQTPFDAQMDPRLLARFETDIKLIGRSRDRYEGLSLLQVTNRLSEDYRDFAKLTTSAPFAEMRRRARAHGVKFGRSPYQPTFDLLLDQIDPQPCFFGVLTAIEAGPEPNRRAAQAWARGDVAGALQAPRGDRWWRCVGGPWLAIEDHTQRIEEALKTPGHAVAAITLHSLLAENGVIQRLRADGFEVEEPDEFAP